MKKKKQMRRARSVKNTTDAKSKEEKTNELIIR